MGTLTSTEAVCALSACMIDNEHEPADPDAGRRMNQVQVPGTHNRYHIQARTGDWTLQAAAFASGGQFVSTDYVVPNPDFDTGYFAEVPGGHVVRCNPLSATPGCDASQLSP